MKVTIYFLAIFLITSCSSNKEVFKQLKDNAVSYNRLKMTKSLLTKSAVMYVTYNKESRNFKIDLNSRDREVEITIRKCLINKKDAVIEATDSSSFEWQRAFVVYSSTLPKKSTRLSCLLNSGDRFSVTF